MLQHLSVRGSGFVHKNAGLSNPEKAENIADIDLNGTYSVITLRLKFSKNLKWKSAIMRFH